MVVSLEERVLVPEHKNYTFVIIMIMVNTIVKVQLQSPPKIPVVEESLQVKPSIQTARD